MKRMSRINLLVLDRRVYYIMVWVPVFLVVLATGNDALTTANQKVAANLALTTPNGGASTSFGTSTLNGTESSIQTGASTMVGQEFSLSSHEKAKKQIHTMLAATSGDGQGQPDNRPLKILFLSADTGGGHRASAEALAKQFEFYYPGSTYDLLDVWTPCGVYPYKTLVSSYKHMSARPLQWKLFYHLSNTVPNELFSTIHSTLMCERKIRKWIASYKPDVVVSVHPTMNYTPLISTKRISKALGKHIPFFTVVTDFGSAHCMWFQRRVDKMYLASERLRKIAKRRGTPDESIKMSGLPIRHDFAVEAANMGCRTSAEGKEYQKNRKISLGLNQEKKMVLVMGGGEGVGSLSDIVNELYTKFTQQGVDATICVVCGRNEKLKKELEVRNWDEVIEGSKRPKKKRQRLLRFLKRKRSKHVQKALDKAARAELAETPGNVEVIGLGFVNEMAAYMAAADVLVTKAGPGTIAEAAAVGLPVMLTSFLPGQEAGNVDLVLENGFGDFDKDPDFIANEVATWMKDDKLLAKMSVAAQKVGHPDAASEIVQDIGEITHTWMDLNGEKQESLA